MDIQENGYDCKGNYYEKASILKIRKNYTGKVFGWLKVLFCVNLPYKNEKKKERIGCANV